MRGLQKSCLVNIEWYQGDSITILVTGATGRIGRHLVESLLKENEKVRVLIRDKMTEFENVEVFYGDLKDKASLEKAVKGVDTIFHLAALVDYTADDDEMYKVNVIGTNNLLEAFKGNKFIYLSTTAVLGSKLNEPADENTKYNPTNFYGKTKMEAEKLVRSNGGIIVRAPDVLMPGFTEGYDAVFSKLMEGSMPIVGDGRNFVDYINIRDLVKALLLAREKGRSSEIYNVCGKGVNTLNEWFEIASKYLNVEMPKHVPSVTVKMSLFGSNIKSKIGAGEKDSTKEYMEKLLRSRTYDITKARNELGFEPEVNLDTSLKEMVDNYLSRAKEEQDEITEENSEQES